MSRLLGRWPRVLVTLAVLGLLAMSIMAAPALAAGSAPSSVSGAPAAGTLPNSNIVLNTHGKAAYNPKAFHAPLTVGTCTTSNYSFSVNNETTASQQVMYAGSPLGGSISPESALYICISVSGTYVFNLQSNTKPTLTVTSP